MQKFDLDQLLKKYKLEKQKDLVVKGLTLAGIGAVAVYLLFAVTPLIMANARLIGEFGGLKAKLMSADEAIAGKNSIEEKYAMVKDRAEIYEKKLPREQDIPLLLEDLSAKAKATYVKITGINPVMQKTSVKDAKTKDSKSKSDESKARESKTGRSKKKTNEFRQISIMITAQGGYQQLGSFISRIENGDRFIKIDTLNISSNAGNKRLHNIELLITTFALMGS